MESVGSDFLTAGDCDAVEALMRRVGWLNADERILSCDRAGEGNMNLTLRVRTDQRSVILKQSRPWVEKYPQVPAPVERVTFEHRFYEAVAAIPAVAGRMPTVLGFSEADHVLLLEDLGQASDFTGLYQGKGVDADTLIELARWLRALHDGDGANRGLTQQGAPSPSLSHGEGRRACFANRAMRALNHEHIFVLPLQADNGLDLEVHESGLEAAAAKLKADDDYRRRVEAAGERYLADGPRLLHGDYFPGSWLRTKDGVRIIDPEFCFMGDPAWDVGVTVAHLALSRESGQIGVFLDAYGRDTLDPLLLVPFAAAEVMRRLIGVAQLPIPRADGWRVDLLERSRRAMVTDSLEPLCQD